MNTVIDDNQKVEYLLAHTERNEETMLKTFMVINI